MTYKIKKCCKKLENCKEIDIYKEIINVMGCCDKCYILEDMEYCPYCGIKLELIEEWNII